MNVFGKFFERVPEEGQKQEEESAIRELESIPLTRTNISLLSPEEVRELHKRISDLHRKLKFDKTYLPPSENVQAMFTKTNDEILNYLSPLSEQEQEFFHRLIDDQLLESDIEEKFREYDKEHWREVFQNEINKGITPFGDEHSFMVDIYKEQGVNLENPTQEDRDKFFERKEYQGGAFSSEFKRRRLKDFQVVDRQAITDIEELFWALLRVDGKTLYGRKRKQKLLEIKKKLNL